MPDEIDQIQETYERELNSMLAERLNHRPASESRRDCIDCEEPIPEARRKAAKGCQRCIACQTLHENWRPM